MNSVLSPFIIGAPRSGTTLLRMMLDTHSDLSIPPETGFILKIDLQKPLSCEDFYNLVLNFPPDATAWRDYKISDRDFRDRLNQIDDFNVVKGIRCFYQTYADRFKKPRWGDKTPSYAFCVDKIAELLPKARFIHIIRDGRDVAVSLRTKWFRTGNSIRELAQNWIDFVQAGRKNNFKERYLEVFFEDLIINTEETLRKICSFIELDYQEKMLEYYKLSGSRIAEHETRYNNSGDIVVTDQQRQENQKMVTVPPDTEKIGSWKKFLTSEEICEFNTTAKTLLKELGYET